VATEVVKGPQEQHQHEHLVDGIVIVLICCQIPLHVAGGLEMPAAWNMALL
jgi:predicted histidine transporter YuiF (NhaC family)